MNRHPKPRKQSFLALLSYLRIGAGLHSLQTNSSVFPVTLGTIMPQQLTSPGARRGSQILCASYLACQRCPCGRMGAKPTAQLLRLYLPSAPRFVNSYLKLGDPLLTFFPKKIHRSAAAS